MQGLSVVAERGAYVLATTCRLLTAVAAFVAEHRFMHTGFSSCSSGAQKLGHTGLAAQWHRPHPGIEPMFAALADGFLTT